MDLAIDWLPVELDPFVNRKLFDERMVFVASRTHPRVRTGITVEELRKEEFIGMHYRREAAPPGYGTPLAARSRGSGGGSARRRIA